MGGRGQSMASRQSASGLNGGNKTYSATIQNAIGKQGTPMGMKQAVKANGVDKNGKRLHDNCQRCIYAYEMRRRGYDVEALPSKKFAGTGRDSLQYESGKYSFLNVMKGAKYQMTSFAGKSRVSTQTAINTLENQMKTYGDGARCAVVIQYKGGTSGHTFIVEQHNGQTVWVDPQTAHKINPASGGYLGGATNKYTYMFRIDNCDPTDLIAKCVTTR